MKVAFLRMEMSTGAHQGKGGDWHLGVAESIWLASQNISISEFKT